MHCQYRRCRRCSSGSIRVFACLCVTELCYVTNASLCSLPGGSVLSRTRCTGSAGSVCRMRRTLPPRSCTAALWWSVEVEPDTWMRHPGCRSPQRQSGPLASSQHPQCRQRHLSRDSPLGRRRRRRRRNFIRPQIDKCTNYNTSHIRYTI